MIVVINETSRGTDSAEVIITFVDESGRGIARYRIQDSSGEILQEGDLDCPRRYRTDPIKVANDRFPLSAHSAECGESGSDSGPEGYTNETQLEIRHLIPVDPQQNPCSVPSDLMEERGTPCWHARELVFGIVAEIEELCPEWARHREDFRDHSSKRVVFTAAATVLLVACAVCGFLATKVPFPANIVLAIAAAALFAATLVMGSLAWYHTQEENRARRNLEDVEARLADARNRYRAAVEDAIRACCGRVPSGMELDPPECEDIL